MLPCQVYSKEKSMVMNSSLITGKQILANAKSRLYRRWKTNKQTKNVAGAAQLVTDAQTTMTIVFGFINVM